MKNKLEVSDRRASSHTCDAGDEHINKVDEFFSRLLFGRFDVWSNISALSYIIMKIEES